MLVFGFRAGEVRPGPGDGRRQILVVEPQQRIAGLEVTTGDEGR